MQLIGCQANHGPQRFRKKVNLQGEDSSTGKEKLSNEDSVTAEVVGEMSL